MQKEFEDYQKMLMLIQQDVKDMRERFLLNDLNPENFRDGNPLEDDIISLKKQIFLAINRLIVTGIGPLCVTQGKLMPIAEPLIQFLRITLGELMTVGPEI